MERYIYFQSKDNLYKFVVNPNQTVYDVIISKINSQNPEDISFIKDILHQKLYFVNNLRVHIQKSVKNISSIFKTENNKRNIKLVLFTTEGLEEYMSLLV